MNINDGSNSNIDIYDDEFVENHALTGGALYINGGNTSITKCAFKKNTANKGGDISLGSNLEL